MKVKKGQRLRISHLRKGTFVATALQDFDTEETEWFPVALVEGYTRGLARDWVIGEEVPCRASLTRINEVL